MLILKHILSLNTFYRVYPYERGKNEAQLPLAFLSFPSCNIVGLLKTTVWFEMKMYQACFVFSPDEEICLLLFFPHVLSSNLLMQINQQCMFRGHGRQGVKGRGWGASNICWLRHVVRGGKMCEGNVTVSVKILVILFVF